MTLQYKEKGRAMQKAIKAAGYGIRIRDGVCIPDKPENEAAVQAIIDGFDELANAKKEASVRVIKEASRRVAEIYPFIDPDSESAIGLYEFAIDLYTTTVPAAREALSGRLLEFKKIHDAAQDAITTINSMTDWNEIAAYDATTTPNWTA